MTYPAFPDTVYLDTSYLAKLLTYAKSPKDPDLLKCKRLHSHLLSRNVKLVGSLFTLEETFFFLFFKQVMNTEAKKNKFKDTKQFRRRNPQLHHKFYMSNSWLLKWIVSQSHTMSVEFLHPKYINPNLNMTDRIRQYATNLLTKYSGLDSKDAFHVAAARCMRIDTIISCDRDFLSLTEIRAYIP